ncbi:MAG TPA: dihydropteroate synthase [Flavisolibacter sp.]|nr:dihydropteroate synthase [Flavisolibacter sp.]
MFTLNCKGRLVEIRQPVVMGIINTTPDSFYAGSRTPLDDVLAKAGRMIEEGAFILDIGGQSTRPGSIPLSEEAEMERVLPAIESIHQRYPDQLISIDTFYGNVARASVAAGASIVNDISAGSLDENLLPTVADLRVPYVLMHMKGKPQTMQESPSYEDVAIEVFDFLSLRLQQLTAIGIHDVIIDPGFGFGKTAAHNFSLLNRLSWLTQLERPLLAGLSRKATVYKTLGITAEEALNGTTVLNTIALMNGASILRVHDVKAAVEAVKLFTACKAEGQQ